MVDDLPTNFDLVVIGTGFVESIVAAAVSRIGKTVLHIDSNDFYGSSWASFNLEALEGFFSSIADSTRQSTSIRNISQKSWNTTETAAESDNSRDRMFEQFRRFNIDLTPNLLFSNGQLVSLLISSNICRYVEFRAVDHVCTIINKEAKSVPCSRTDVFNSNDLSIVEKRLLMKLLNSCVNYDEHSEEYEVYKNKTFLQYLKDMNLTDNITHCVLYSISMSNAGTSFNDGIKNTRKFLNSLGRYGNTPFLFPMYGCGEIPQCFCRLCAVFGGIYCLKRSVENVTLVDSKVESLTCGNQRIMVKNVVIGHGSALTVNGIPIVCRKQKKEKCGGISRAILIASSPLGEDVLNSSAGGVNFLKLPSEDGTGALIFQLSHYSGTCPKGFYLIHITCAAKSENPEADISPFLNMILETNDKPIIVYSKYFTIASCLKCSSAADTINLSNVFSCCGPYVTLDYDTSINDAKAIFREMYPDQEFLPRAPDPEEIIVGDEDPTATANDITLDSITQEIMEVEADLLVDKQNRTHKIDSN